MSTVYERNRSLSELQWIMTARKIRIEIDQIAHSEKVIPKSWRFTHAVRLCDIAADLVHHTRAAYDRYPSSALALRERKHFVQLAIDDCYYLVDDLQNLKDVGLPINLNRFERIAELLDQEIGLLKGLKRNARLTGSKTVEERMAKLEMELADLQALKDGE